MGKIKIVQWRDGLPKGYDISDDAKNDFEEMDYAIVNAKEFKPLRKGFKTMSITELTTKVTEKPKPIIRNLLYEKGVTVIAGTDGVGKTWLATQAALSIATGTPFLEWETSQKPVLLVQFELSSELLSSRLRKQMKSFPTVPNGYLDVVCIDIEDKLFTSQWEKIKNTLMENNHLNGVVIVDNLYTSVTGDVSDNTQMMKILSDVAEIRNSTGNAIVLVAHHNKGTLIDKQLYKDQIQGGKQLTNFVSNVLQIGESKLSTELRVAKITKIRDEQSELENIPFKLHWDNDSVTFSRGSIIQKEEVHFIEPKERWDIKVIIEFYSYESLNKSETFPKFDRVRITNFLEAHWNDVVHHNKVTRLLNRLVEWNLVIKHKHNDYELNIDVLKECIS
jgi:RecA-family ATPase